jgi:hypothetical protein
MSAQPVGRTVEIDTIRNGSVSFGDPSQSD